MILLGLEPSSMYNMKTRFATQRPGCAEFVKDEQQYGDPDSCINLKLTPSYIIPPPRKSPPPYPTIL